jgi:uncharacterized membrane protein
MRDLVAAESPRLDRARRMGLAFVFLWFLIGGVAHFVATDTEVRLEPPYIPWPPAAVLRMPLQVALLALIAWSTFRKARS